MQLREHIDTTEYFEEDLKSMIARGKRFAHWTAGKIVQIKKGMGTEKQETKDMMKIFFRLLYKKLFPGGKRVEPSKEEIKRAIAQLKDVGKVAVIAGILLIPLAFDDLSIIGLELLARKFGLTFLPSAMKGLI